MFGIGKKDESPFQGITEKELEQMLEKFYHDEMANFEKKLADKDAEISTLKNLNSNVIEASQEISDVKSQNRELQEEKSAREKKMNELMFQNETIAQENERLTEKILVLTSRISENSDKSQQFLDLTAENQALYDEKDAQEKVINDLKIQEKNLVNKLEEVIAEKTELLNELTNLQAQLAETVVLESIPEKDEEGLVRMEELNQKLVEKDELIKRLTLEVEQLKAQASVATDGEISKEDLADILLTAKSSANNMVQKAKEREAEIIEQAKSEASDIIKATEERVALSKVQSENLIEDATHQAEIMLGDAKTEAEQIIVEAKERHDYFKREGDAYYANLFELATENSDFLRRIKERSGFSSIGEE